MNIRPSAAIRQNYNEIADMCRKTAEPVFLTKNGEGDLVVMDIETFNRREKMLKLREELLAVEEDRMAGRSGCTVDELDAYLEDVIAEEIIAAIRSLNYMPQRFPFFEEAYIPPNKYHKMFIEKWYLVLYQIQDDTVYVEYIVDCRKDYNWLIH